jgi:Mlc titration factor MtfA (ptsG expression regulator)
MSRVSNWLRQLFATAPVEFDEAWRPVLVGGFQHWSLLTAVELERMEQLVARFMATTDWEAANRFELTEHIKVLIAAQASMLLLGLDLDGYDDVTSVIVHPSNVRLPGTHTTGGGVFSSQPRMISGLAQAGGPVVLSWAAARRGARFPDHGHNVVYHEFAHRLDMLDGATDGTPPLSDDAAVERWREVCTAAYDTVRAEGSPVLRPYAGTNPAEFFAVATEVFFNQPCELFDHEPALYAELMSFYGQDPSQRIRRQSSAANVG